MADKAKELNDSPDIKEEYFEFDEILEKHVGECGRYQILLCSLLILTNFCTCLQSLNSVFIAGVPDHWCLPESRKYSPNLLRNCSTDQIKSLTVPKDKENGKDVFSQCEIYADNITSFKFDGASCSLADNVTYADDSRVECTRWQYDHTYFSSLVEEWNLVCSRAGLVWTVAGAIMLGRVLGCLFSGPSADRFGRRKTMIVFGVLYIIANFISIAMPNYTAYAIAKIFLSTFVTASYNAAYIQAVELVGPSKRVALSCVWHLLWACGYIVLTFLAYFIRDWRVLQGVCTIPDILLIISWIILVPESPRWLLVQNRKDEAMKILETIARRNGNTLPTHAEVFAEDAETGGFLDLFRTPAIRWTTLLLFYNWFSGGFVYYGLSLNTTSLGGNPYVNFLFSGLVEFPAYFYIWWSLIKFGRLKPFGLIFCAAGVALLCIMVVPPDINWLTKTFAMLGKLAITASFGMSWVYSVEIYPTSIRSLGVNTCSMFARFGSVAASYVGELAAINRELPLVIFGVMALVGGILVLVFPETRDQPMRQTVHEGEVFIRENMCSFPWCRRFKKQHTKVDTEKKVDV